MQLTKREREVAGLLAQGQSNREIALLLSLSEHTVRTYVSRILHKLNLPNRAAIAATWAREHPEAQPPTYETSEEPVAADDD